MKSVGNIVNSNIVPIRKFNQKIKLIDLVFLWDN